MYQWASEQKQGLNGVDTPSTVMTTAVLKRPFSIQLKLILKLFGQCPYGNNTFEEGASLNTRAAAVLINSTNTKTNIYKTLNTNKRGNFAFNKYKDKYKRQIKGRLCIWPYMQIVGDLWNRLVAPQSLLCALNTHFRLSRKTTLALLLFTVASTSDE